MQKNGLLEIIAAHRTGDDLDEVLKKDKDYQEALAEQQEAFDRLDGMELLDRMRCYQSESAAFPHPRSEEALCALAAFRGSNIGVGRAEAFMALREVYR